MSDAPDLIAAIEQALRQQLVKQGVEATCAEIAAKIATEHVRAEWGGERHYIKSDARASRKARNARIIADWKAGKDRAEIAKREGVDRSTVTRVINNHLAAITPQGFGSGEWNL